MVKRKTQVLAVLLELNFMEGRIPACLGPGLGWGYGGAKAKASHLKYLFVCQNLGNPW